MPARSLRVVTSEAFNGKDSAATRARNALRAWEEIDERRELVVLYDPYDDPDPDGDCYVAKIIWAEDDESAMDDLERLMIEQSVKDTQSHP